VSAADELGDDLGVERGTAGRRGFRSRIQAGDSRVVSRWTWISESRLLIGARHEKTSTGPIEGEYT